MSKSDTKPIKVGYADFIRLCRITNPDEWAEAHYLHIAGDGVYVKDPGGYLTPVERAELTWHPTGNLAEPALKFPCSLKELQKFLEGTGTYGCIDPFDMAEWVSNQVQLEGAVKAEKPLGTRERNTLLTIIAALCDHATISPDDRSAATDISTMTQKIGTLVDRDTIKKHLDAIPDALETRMK